MQRNTLTPRHAWQQKVESQGLIFHTLENGQPYWDESANYQFTAAEIDTLEAAGNTLQEMCLAAAQNIIDNQRYAELDIPAEAVPAIEQAWNSEPPALYGRFDISWAGAQSGQPPKLLEYNADTPTSLLEAAVIQWNWLEELGDTLRPPFTNHKPDQFNSIHEKLIAKWKDIDSYLTKPVYFAGVDVPEDQLTLAYLRDTAIKPESKPCKCSWKRLAGTTAPKPSSTLTTHHALHLQALPVGSHANRAVRRTRHRHLP